MIKNQTEKILSLFKDFEDESLQVKLWYGLVENKWWSTSEQMMLIDDVDLEGWLEERRKIIPKHLVKYIELFIELNSKAFLSDDPLEIFISKEWYQLRRTAHVISILLQDLDDRELL